jgi:hypothetical protein
MHSVALVVTVSTLLAACAATSPTPSPAATAPETSAAAATAPATSAPATRPSTGPTTEPSLAPTHVTSSAMTTALSLRSAPAAPCREDATAATCIKPGTYLLDPTIPPGTVTLDVPAGWFEWDEGGGTEGLLVNTGRGAPDGSGWGLLLSAVGTVPLDPCGGIRGSVPADQAASVDGVLKAIASWPGFHASAPARPVRLGGVQGRMVELTYTGDPARCPSSQLWTTPSGIAVDAYPMVGGTRTRPAQLYLFAIGDRLLIIRTTDYPQQSPFEETQGIGAEPTRHALDQVALRSILSSIRFGPAGG